MPAVSPRRGALAALLAAAIAAGCVGGASSPAPPPTAPPAAPAAEPALSWIEQVRGGQPDDRLPMLVLLHGLGDTPEAFIRLAGVSHRPVRVIALRPPTAHGDGFAWFPPGPPGDGMGPEVALAADQVSETVRALVDRRPTVGAPVVAGFSQGAAVTFALAARHPDQFAALLPVAGWLPSSLLPASVAARPAVVALHGEADTRVPFALGQAAVAGLQRAGLDAHLDPFAGVDHQIPAPVGAALGEAIDQLLPR